MDKVAQSLDGVFSLLLTPFADNGSVDWSAYERYVEWQLSFHPRGLFAVCGTSEMKWLTLEERIELARRAAKQAGSTPVIATANLGPDILQHKEEVDRMTETGISGIVLVPPPGLGNDSKRFEQYMAELIEYASVPVFLYEWPQVDPHFVPPDMLSRLSRRYRLAGIKDTTCTIEGIQAKIVAAGPEMVVYQANTPFLVEAIESGARGIMAVTSAACADLVIRTYEAIIHRHESVRVLHQQLVFLDSVLRFAYPATAKYLANLRGIPMNLACRWPVHVPREAFKAVEVFADAASLYHLQTP